MLIVKGSSQFFWQCQDIRAKYSAQIEMVEQNRKLLTKKELRLKYQEIYDACQQELLEFERSCVSPDELHESLERLEEFKGR